MVRERYLTGLVRAETDTDKAFLCSFNWSDTHGYVASELWVPKKCIFEDDHDTIEEAVRGEMIEISIAEWWLNQTL